MVLAATGQLDTVYLYDPYGNVVAFSGSKTPNPLQHAGEYRDPESGLIYLRTRYCDPRTAQFVTRDPIAVRTREAYVYVHDAPLNARDPLGLDSNVGCPCLAYDLSHPNPVDILRDSYLESVAYLMDIYKESGIAGVAKLATWSGRFVSGLDYATAFVNAEILYSDVHDADLHAWGLAASIYVQEVGPAAGGVFGLVLVGAAGIESGPLDIVLSLAGFFGGAVIGGIVAYLMDTFGHCLYVQAKYVRHHPNGSGGGGSR